MKKLVKIFKGLSSRLFPEDYSFIQPPEEILLWPEKRSPKKEKLRIVGGALRVVSNIHNPSITPFLPDPSVATGAAVIIAPGGSHTELWIDHEGYHVAEWLREKGVAAFVLKYRLANEPGSPYTVDEHALCDMQRAIRLVRSMARKWGLNKSAVGVMGFSAGGELAALAASRFDFGKSTEDKIDIESSYPNFQALIYPAGIDQLKVLKNSPPLFLLGGWLDDPEISEGISKIYLKYKRAGIFAEMYIYADAGHGFGVRKNDPAAVSKWPLRFEEWLGRCAFLRKKEMLVEQ